MVQTYVADGRLDDGGVVGVGNQGDGLQCMSASSFNHELTGFTHKSVLGNLSIESLLVRDVEGDGGGALDALGELLGVLEGTAGYTDGWLVVSHVTYCVYLPTVT